MATFIRSTVYSSLHKWSSNICGW